MKITDIYEKYKIPPMLQLHQLRVAGVASLICNNLNKELDKTSIVTACLLHDMGNILKFNFDVFPNEFYGEKGKDFFIQVKEEFKKRYGEDEHFATEAIAKELAITKGTMDLLKSVGFRKAQNTYISGDLGLKATCYSDHRVSPFGITSMKERFDEGLKRNMKNRPGKFTREGFKMLASYWYKVEQQIFVHCSIKPEDITDQSVNPLIEKLREFEI